MTYWEAVDYIMGPMRDEIEEKLRPYAYQVRVLAASFDNDEVDKKLRGYYEGTVAVASCNANKGFFGAVRKLRAARKIKEK